MSDCDRYVSYNTSLLNIWGGEAGRKWTAFQNGDGSIKTTAMRNVTYDWAVLLPLALPPDLPPVILELLKSEK